jgi:hypothetical protein
MPSAKVAEFLTQAEYYRGLKEQLSHRASREILEQMENSYRVLARSQEQLESSKHYVQALNKLRPEK